MKAHLKNTLFPAMLLGVTFLNFGCEKEELPEEEIYHLQVFAVGPNYDGWTYDFHERDKGEIPHYFGEAKVSLYENEEDYILSTNPVHEGETDENGYFYKEFSQPDTFWVDVEKGELSMNRIMRYYERNWDCSDKSTNMIIPNKVHLNVEGELEKLREGKEGRGSWLFATLTPNPTQLQIKVYHNGQPVNGARVDLYFSEEAYNQDFRAWQEIEELKKSYGTFTEEEIEYYKSSSRTVPCLLKNFTALTDAAGEVYFDNLEPRQYWFRIEKEGLSNEGGTFKLDEALSDNPDITTSITVGIQ